MSKKHNPILIIGGGGAGLIAAWRSASTGADVIILERNRKLGMKLRISGGGKCNITHAGPMEELRKVFLPREARFLKPAFHRFTNDDIISILEREGVPTYVRPNGRVFPVSDRADDVVDVLNTILVRQRVEVILGVTVDALSRDKQGISGVRAGGKVLSSSHVVLATGGVSYPKIGTTGDGFIWARDFGHAIVPLRPALAPIGVAPPLPLDWRGVAIRGGSLTAYAQGRKLLSWSDDILFTHEGISGPAALEISRAAAVAREKGSVTLELDFFPAMEFNLLDQELNSTIQRSRSKMIGSILDTWLPNRIVPHVLMSIGVDPSLRGYVLTREQRRAVTRLLKGWSLGEVSLIDIRRGEVTAGGIDLSEVEPHTMKSRKVRGLYLCGEILDIAGPVGGYNLQAAFSTGFIAGETAAHAWIADAEVRGRTME